MDAISWEVDGQPEAKEGVHRVKVRNRVCNREYALEVFEDERGETWVRVHTEHHNSQPIPFADFVVGNQ